MNNITFNDLSKCVGCFNCYNVCPKKSIKMEENELGHLLPQVDNTCVKCGKCLNVCQINFSFTKSSNIKSYAYQNSVREELNNASSGGAFSHIAKYVIENNGSVFGSTLVIKNNNIDVYHKKINKLEEIVQLQGSKYVQSRLSNVFLEVKNELKIGKLVLFVGTPCQIYALQLFLGENNDNLLTVSLICHGVPSLKMLNEYVLTLLKKEEILLDFKFRDKEKSWGLYGSYTVKKKNGKVSKKFFNCDNSSYYRFFLEGYSYRNACYSCKFANYGHQSDITIGDYWGYKGKIKTKDKGISSIIVNSNKGFLYFKKIFNNNYFEETSFENIAKENKQLTESSKKPKKHQLFIDTYEKNGYIAASKCYYQIIGKKNTTTL